MITNPNMAICLWFDGQAEEAAKFYTSIFTNSSMGAISRYGNGSVMVAAFQINDMKFTALNGGHQFKFNESISLQVYCDTQEEIDYYWVKLTEGGQEQPCGWLKDKYGVSWQIVPSVLGQLMSDADKAKRVTATIMKMKKLVIEELENA